MTAPSQWGKAHYSRPSAEIGVRLDGGDAESGAGIEAGAGLRYNAGPLSIEGSVRTLLAHEESGTRSGARAPRCALSERLRTGTVAHCSAPRGAMRRARRSACGQHATQAHWGFGDEFEGRAHLDSELGYGFPLARSQALLTPYAGLALGEGGQRAWRGGARWQLGADIEARMEATHDGRDANALTGAKHAALLSHTGFARPGRGRNSMEMRAEAHKLRPANRSN